MYSKITTYINELIFFSLVHLILNAKNLIRKTCGNVFLGHVGWWDFHVFPRLHLIMGDVPSKFLKICMDCGTIFNSRALQHLRWSSLWQEIGDSWKVLLTVFSEKFALNVTGILSGSDKSQTRLDQTFMFKLSKKKH